ncbi:hypothetical protein [Treponema socranskii]|uniref:hypothetical protein n=1 Tax=Treponema socranskii TaxID=53419 RepID=UPI003D900940
MRNDDEPTYEPTVTPKRKRTRSLRQRPEGRRRRLAAGKARRQMKRKRNPGGRDLPDGRGRPN